MGWLSVGKGRRRREEEGEGAVRVREQGRELSGMRRRLSGKLGRIPVI